MGGKNSENIICYDIPEFVYISCLVVCELLWIWSQKATPKNSHYDNRDRHHLLAWSVSGLT